MNQSFSHGCLNCLARQLVLVCLLFALSSSTLVAAQWQVKEFEVFTGRPNAFGREAELIDSTFSTDALDFLDRDLQEELIKLEDFLHDVAVEYEKMGFADPVASGDLKPVYRHPTGKKIRVYLVDVTAWNKSITLESSGLAQYVDKCSKLGQYNAILIHRPDAFENRKLKETAYQSAAHELFHAVQAASTFKKIPRPCGIGKWITEGTADAIGFDMARQLRGFTFPEWRRNLNFMKIWGSRRYDQPLSQPPNKAYIGYRSSSFWRHLAEVTHVKKNRRDHPGSDKTRTDYSYLVDLFGTRLPGPGARFEVQWVSDWIRGYPHTLQDLSRVYAQFTASIADYWAPGKRITGVSISGGDYENRWRNKLFGKCQVANLSKNTPGHEFHIIIEKNAAKCFEVRAAGKAQAAELVIQEKDLPRSTQEQLRIGAVGGHLVGSPFILPVKGTREEGSEDYPIWRFPFTQGTSNIFVISNMAKNAQDTVRAEATLHVSNPYWQSSMTKNSANPPVGSSGKPQQPKTRADASKHIRALRKNPTTQSAMAAFAIREGAGGDEGCEGHMKIANLCGPQLRITLVKDSGMPGFGFVGGAGGIMKQMEAGGAAFELDDQFQIESLGELAKQNEGRMIELSIPLVDYGYQGTVKNAQVHVSKSSAGNFMAVQRSPDSNGFYPPNGSVTIDEYSPMLLSGRFSASLVDSQAVNNITRSNPVLPPAGNITGRFVVSAPWRGSNFSPEFDGDSLMMNDMLQDMMSMLMKMSPELRRTVFTGDRLDGLCEMGISDEQLAALDIVGSCSDRGSPGLTAAEPDCLCSCDLFEMEKNHANCQQQCDSIWILEQCGVDASADPEVARYAAESRKLNLPAQLHKAQVANFQNSPPYVRKLLWQELEKLKQRLGAK